MTALDDFVTQVKCDWIKFGALDEYALDQVVRGTIGVLPGHFHDAIQDPRYLEYCKEQDAREEISE